MFIELWPQFAGAMRQYCYKKFQCEKHTEWADDVENLLLLMKVLTVRGNKQPFKNLIEKIIVFKVVRFTIEIEYFSINFT